MPTNRRLFLRHAGLSAAATRLSPALLSLACGPGADTEPESDVVNGAAAAAPWFRISLAEWSLHRALLGGEMTNLDFITEADRKSVV